MEGERKPRGAPATFDRRTGEAQGSGSGAGGGAPGEDYDDDPQGGGGAEPVGSPRVEDDEERGTSRGGSA